MQTTLKLVTPRRRRIDLLFFWFFSRPKCDKGKVLLIINDLIVNLVLVFYLIWYLVTYRARKTFCFIIRTIQKKSRLNPTPFPPPCFFLFFIPFLQTLFWLERVRVLVSFNASLTTRVKGWVSTYVTKLHAFTL